MPLAKIILSGRTLLWLAVAVALAALPAGAALWSTGYYPGYRQAYYPPSAIDFTALTHVIHFAVQPNTDGTLNTTVESLSPAYCADLIAHAHSAGVKALICVGGGGTEAGFQGATSSAHLSAFVTNVVTFLSTYGYDGVDLDWEPLTSGDTAQFTNLVNGLRAALNGFSPPRLLTAATASLPAVFGTLTNQLDQINLMTYDLAGAWPGWVTWFNAPIYDGGYRFPSTGGLVPSAHGMVTNFIANKVPAARLGIGLAFYGKMWTAGAGTSTGGTLLPRQSWTTTPTVTAVSYFNIVSNYYQTGLYHWDDGAQSAYLSITNAIATNDIFLAYDDARTCQAKVSYARNGRLGGVMIWEIGQGYLAAQPVGQREPLLQAVKQALFATPDITALDRVNQDLRLSFATLPLGLYRVQWTPTLPPSFWNTITNNFGATGGIAQIIDFGVLSNQLQRFYRIQTPP